MTMVRTAILYLHCNIIATAGPYDLATTAVLLSIWVDVDCVLPD